jgi:hypothetical protein
MRGIEFEIVWLDQDVIKYRVRCSNGSLCGEMQMYASYDGLRDAADILSGFPQNPGDSRLVEVGTLQPNMAGGGIRMEFSCIDSVGHAVVSVKLRSEHCRSMGEAQSVCLLIPVDAGAIDAFVSQARAVGTDVGAKAYLHMADHTQSWVQRWFEKNVGRRPVV